MIHLIAALLALAAAFASLAIRERRWIAIRRADAD